MGLLVARVVLGERDNGAPRWAMAFFINRVRTATIVTLCHTTLHATHTMAIVMLA